MVSRSLVAACSLAAALCLQAAAQSAASPQTASPAPSAAPAQSQAPQSTPPLQLHDLPPDPHTLTPAEAEQAREQKVLAAATRVATEQAHWGPDISTPGVSISLVETGRNKTPQGTQITYRITGSGFTPGYKLNLIRWPLNGQSEVVMGGITFDAQGNAVCAPPAPPAPASLTSAPTPTDAPAQTSGPPCSKQMQPNQPLQLQATAAAGEAVRIALVGEDRKRGAATSAVPFPIVSQDKSCKLEVLRGMKNAEMVLVEGSGFPASSSLKLDAVSYDDSRVLNTKTNAQGKMIVLILPGVKGHESGETTVRFGGMNHPPSLEASSAPPPDPGCSPSVSFHWGTGSYKIE